MTRQQVMTTTSNAFTVGANNLITDVDGLTVGNAGDKDVRTGVTVLLPDAPVIAGVDVRGGGPGTRDTEALDPSCLITDFHGFFLSGGSVFGLSAGDGITCWLSQQGFGLSFSKDSTIPCVPVVPGAVLFDLNNGGNKAWGLVPPYRELGIAACQNASKSFSLGNVGAGIGAIAGSIKGGLGSASIITDDGLQVGALVAVNSVGSPVMPGSNTFWAWDLEQNQEYGGNQQAPPNTTPHTELSIKTSLADNTTIAIVATNLKMTKAQAQRVAMMAHDGLARAIRPIHTPFDGDTVFALSTGKIEMEDNPALAISRVGHLAADCTARAICRGVYEAESLKNAQKFPGVQSYKDRFSATEN